ncbi:MAG: hypothetical protein SFZ03_00400 [Candidatus Melainabacteria bacterium]|nr:hypothetical protein [Candidatus Melainabacteria bacterium]
MFAAYRHCRWYDPYPKLSFALKLFYLAPAFQRAQVIGRLQYFLEHQLGLGPLSQVLNYSNADRQRWSDRMDASAQILEMLKHGPESLKQVSADKLLELLGESTKSPALVGV